MRFAEAAAQSSLVNPVGLVFVRADRGQEAINEMIVLQRHAQLADEPALDHGVFDNPEDEHLGDAAAAILWFDSERYEARGAEPALVVEKFGEADRDAATR